MQAALPAGAVFEPFAPPSAASPSLQQADAYPALLSTSPAGAVSRRLALAVMIVSSAVFFIAAPLAKEPMTPAVKKNGAIGRSIFDVTGTATSDWPYLRQ